MNPNRWCSIRIHFTETHWRRIPSWSVQFGLSLVHHLLHETHLRPASNETTLSFSSWLWIVPPESDNLRTVSESHWWTLMGKLVTMQRFKHIHTSCSTKSHFPAHLLCIAIMKSEKNNRFSCAELTSMVEYLLSHSKGWCRLVRSFFSVAIRTILADRLLRLQSEAHQRF